jgi:Uma2 family endonuclease
MAVQPKPACTFDDWLEAERDTLDSRAEYVRGEVFAMTGASEAHNLIVTNVTRELSTQLKGRPCRLYASDLKLRVDTADAGLYPDLMALCGEREFYGDRRDVIQNPDLIVEVLSDSTEAYTRGDKFAIYRQIPSLKECLLISQHQVRAELFARQPDHRWLLSDYSGLGDTVPLESIGCTLALAEVYDKVDLMPR